MLANGVHDFSTETKGLFYIKNKKKNISRLVSTRQQSDVVEKPLHGTWIAQHAIVISPAHVLLN